MSTGSIRRCPGDGDLSIDLSDVAERTSLRRQFLSTAYVASWPLATDRIFIADIAGPATGSTRPLVTQQRHRYWRMAKGKNT